MPTAYPLTEDMKRRARLLSIAGDETRIRIFCLMFDKGRACVGEIAEALGMSLASISHHLQLMKDNGLFETERDGNMVCYMLKESLFTEQLKSIICE